MTTNSATTPRYYGLDLLRALAILMVILAHYPKGDNAGPFIRLLNFGWAGVDLFFVLSGYLIGRQLLKEVAAGNGIDVRHFYISRLLRTLPCYFLILAVYLLLSAAGILHAPEPLWKFVSFSQNFGIPNTFTPSWSLCVEEHFYLVFPLAMVLYARYGQREHFAKTIISILAFEVVLRATLWLIHRPDLKESEAALSTYMTYFYYPTHSRLDGITLGVGLAGLQHLYPELWQRAMASGNRLLAAGAVSFFGSVLVLWQRNTFLCCTLGFTLVSLSFCCVTAAALSQNSVFTQIRVPGAAWIASLSYSLYLTHSLAIEASTAIAISNGISLQSVLGILLVGSLLAAFGLILYAFVECPLLAVRARLLSISPSRPKSAQLVPISEAR